METNFDLQNQNIEQTNTDNSDTTINDNTFVNYITGSDNSSIITEQITPEISNKRQHQGGCLGYPAPGPHIRPSAPDPIKC